MTRAPFYSPHLSRFRDSTDSSKQNDYLQNVFYDLTELFNLANMQEEQIEEIRKLFEVSSYYAQSSTQKMRYELISLREDLLAIQSPGKTYKKTLHSFDAVLDPLSEDNEQAMIDTQHNLVTLPYANAPSSKVYLYDELNDEYILPNTTKFEVLPVADGISIIENDFKNALTPNDYQLWHRQYRYLSGIKTHVDTSIVLKLPDNIISNRDVNTIYLHTFPMGTIDVINLEYRLDKSWTKVPGFKQSENVDNVKFCFSPTEMSEVRITLRQKHFIQDGDHQVFHVGLREVGISYNDYYMGSCRFEMPIRFSPVFTNKQITNITPVFQNEDTLSVHQKNSRVTMFRVYEVDKNGKQTYIGDTFPIQIKTERALLKGVMSFDRNTRATPALTSVEVSYKGDS